MPLGDSITAGISKKTRVVPVSMPPTSGAGQAACDGASQYAAPDAISYRPFLLDKLRSEGIVVTYVGSLAAVEDLAHEGHANTGRK